jgi:hypothetical protein
MTNAKLWKILASSLLVVALTACGGGDDDDAVAPPSAPVEPTSFRVLPYLQNPAVDAMTVTWLTDTGVAGKLIVDGVGEFESTPDLAEKLDYSDSEVTYIHGDKNHGNIHADVADKEAPVIPYLHRVRVTGLQAHTSYDYTVDQPGADQKFSARFKTLPAAGDRVPLRLVVMADMETEPESTGSAVSWAASDAPNGGDKLQSDKNTYTRQYPTDQTTGYKATIRHATERKPDYWVIAGDLVEKGGRQLDWDEFWRHAAGEWGTLASTTPIFPALGNHENYWHPSEGSYSVASINRAYDRWSTYWELPDNGSSRPRYAGRYYRADIGPVTLITLDSSNGDDNDPDKDTNLSINGAEESVPDFNKGSAQWKWAEAQLADARAKGQIILVQWHHIPYGTGVHSYRSGNAGIANGEDNQSGRPMRIYHELMTRYKVVAVFSGHDELLETVTYEGVQYWDVGFAGDGLRGPGYVPTNTYVPIDALPQEAQDTHWSAHGDALEVWEGERLVSGGKHYGFMEVDVTPDADGSGYTVRMTPRYNFPVMNATGKATGEFRNLAYDKVVEVRTEDGKPVTTAATQAKSLIGVAQSALR